MTLRRRNERWKLMAIGVAFAIGSALETGLVVAQWTGQWTGRYSDQKMVEIAQVCAPLDSGGSSTEQPACAVTAAAPARRGAARGTMEEGAESSEHARAIIRAGMVDRAR